MNPCMVHVSAAWSHQLFLHGRTPMFGPHHSGRFISAGSASDWKIVRLSLVLEMYMGWLVTMLGPAGAQRTSSTLLSDTIEHSMPAWRRVSQLALQQPRVVLGQEDKAPSSAEKTD